MPPPRNPVPSYRLHRPSGRAVVTVRTPEGGRRDVYLGPYGSPESRAEYERVLAQLRAAATTAAGGPRRDPGLTVNELLLAFWEFARGHYRRPDGTATNELNNYRQALRPVRTLYGHTPAAEFGPLALKTVRRRMVDAGLCRRVVNALVGRVRRAWKWAASEELVPVAVYQSLATVGGLQHGRSGVRDPEPVGPVDAALVEATLPHLGRHVRGLVEFQRLTGCRPQDATNLRGDRIDRSGPVWVFRPDAHKTRWRGKVREVFIGPKAQELIAPWLLAAGGGYLFSPRRQVEDHHAARGAARKTPTYPSHRRRVVGGRKSSPKVRPGEKYTTASYGRAVARACLGAGVPHWHPNQLRHAYATEVRRRFGLEAAQVLLGHARADVTQVYAERDAELARRVAGEVG
jgi:integrase